ncbi:MAG: AMP-binding protein [Acidobacteria bacterium]|nr:AMP-binding protein [Acidobacteriota bacterium]
MLEGCTPFPEEFKREYICRGYWKDQTLGELLQQTAWAFPERAAVTDQSRTLTYSEWNLLSDRLALHLLDHGFKSGDIVLLQVPNIWEFNVLLFALLKIGVLPVMCLFQHRHTELSYFAMLTEARGYFFAPQFRKFDYLTMGKELQAEIPTLEYLVAVGDGSATGVSYMGPWLEMPLEDRYPSDYLAKFRPDPFDVAFFLVSGGTTGIPKLIPRTHAEYIYDAQENVKVLGWDSNTVPLIVLPAAHNAPLGQPGLVGTVAVGGRTVMCSSTDPESFFESVERHKATYVTLSPAMLINLLNSPARRKYDLRSLRYMYMAGQKMLAETVEQTWAEWPSLILGQAFGMAEGLSNKTRPDDPKEVIRDTQGRPVSPADEIRIVDNDDKDVPPGEVGELITRGPYTVRGYYKAEEHNRVAFTTDGFYRTGDMVRMHPTGNLVVEGRRKDMINRGGEKISAEEVENLILGHEGVYMTAVVAMPDPVMGERTCAFIVPKPGHDLTLEALNEFLMEKRIAKFKLPERLEVVPSFPLTGVGKIAKKDLRDQIANKLRAEGKLGAVR